MNKNQLRVCYFGTYRESYSRNRIMLDGLRLAGVEVVECHMPLWSGVDDRVQVASGGWRSRQFVKRVFRTYLSLLNQYRHVGNYDVMVVGYPGQFDVYLARILTRLRRKPLVWDVFMSVYLIALERGLYPKSPFTISVLRQLEAWACCLPDGLIIDTIQYAEWFEKMHGIVASRFCLVPTGADDRLFLPLSDANDGIFKVVYYGSFIPNHGVRYIIEAADLLKSDADIQFELVGAGPDKSQAQALADIYQLKNITFINWLNQAELVNRIRSADVLLGVFGTTPQSMMTVQNKIYEALSMRRAVITGDAPAIRNTFQHGHHLLLVERANSQALAEAIVLLKTDCGLRRHLAEAGYERVRDNFSVLQIGRRFLQCLRKVA